MMRAEAWLWIDWELRCERTENGEVKKNEWEEKGKGESTM